MARVSAGTYATTGFQTKGRGGGAWARRALLGIAALLATIPVSATSPSSEGLGQLAGLRHLVQTQGACALPGCTVRYDTFLPVMWRAVARGFVTHADACFVNEGLRHGFKAARLIRCGHHNWVMVLTTHLHSGCISVYIVDPHIDGKVTEIPTI